MKRPGIADRLEAAALAARASWSGSSARRGQRQAWVELGQLLAEGAVAPGPELKLSLEDVGRLDAVKAALEDAATASLARDRADYAAVTRWARPAVVARGAADRVVIHSRGRKLRKTRLAACGALGRLAQQSAGLEGLARDVAGRARELGAAAEEADAARGRALQRLGRVWVVLSAVSAEAHLLGKTLVRELHGKVPRLPSLAGLAAGWWFARTFTDSSFSATLHSFGIGSGPVRAVRSETYRAMAFWLPLAAAVICSYASARLSGWIDRRYAVGTGDPTLEPPPQLR